MEDSKSFVKNCNQLSPHTVLYSGALDFFVILVFLQLKDEGLPTGSKVWFGTFCCCLCPEHLAGGRCWRYDVSCDVIWHRFDCYEFPWLLPLRGYTRKKKQNIKQSRDQRQFYLHVQQYRENILIIFCCEINHTGLLSFPIACEFKIVLSLRKYFKGKEISHYST